MKFTIIWPEKREVSEDQIKQWAKDAVSNNQMHDPYQLSTITVDLEDAEDCAISLHCAGLITLVHKSI